MIHHESIIFLVCFLLPLVTSNQQPYNSYSSHPFSSAQASSAQYQTSSNQYRRYEQQDNPNANTNPIDKPSNQGNAYSSFTGGPPLDDPRYRPSPSQGYPPFTSGPSQSYRRNLPQYYNPSPSLQQQQQEGFFSRLKNTIAAAGSAVMNSLDLQGQPDYLGGVGVPATPAHQGYSSNYRSNYPPQYPPPPATSSSPSFFDGNRETLPHSYGPPAATSNPNLNDRFVPPGSDGSSFPPFRSEDRTKTSSPFPSGDARLPMDANNGWNPSQSTRERFGVAAGNANPFAAPAMFDGRSGDQLDLSGPKSPSALMGDSFNPSGNQFRDPQPLVPVDPFENFPTDPQVLIHEDSIVMIMKPRELAKKKHEMKLAGPQHLQFFTDFEHVLTKFRHEDGSETLGSRELVEFAGILSPEAVRQLQQLTEGFNRLDIVDDENYEEVTQKSQQIIISQGNLHSAHIGPATRALLSKLGLRDGWKETLQGLSSQGVPTFVFSSGYGDVIANALLLGGVSSARPEVQGAMNANVLPQNLRIISNFFRAAPDGTVRAFSQPTVHDRNKNISTAERHMGMPVLNRPYSIVLGSEEEDVHMTEGLSGLKQQISVGFIELSDDFMHRLPNFLSTYDVVIIGEGNLKYVQHMIEEILQLPSVARSSNSQNSNSNSNSNTRRLGLAFGGITKMFMNPGSQESNNDIDSSLNTPPPPPPSSQGMTNIPPGQRLSQYQTQYSQHPSFPQTASGAAAHSHFPQSFEPSSQDYQQFSPN